MFVEILFAVLKAKAHWLITAKIPLIATLLVVSTSAFVVTGTISYGDDGERRVNLTIQPVESKKCIDALIAQTETLLSLDALAADASAGLRRMRDRARHNADELRKMLNEAALLEQYNTFAAKIPDELAKARQAVYAVKDLSACSDGNADTTLQLDIADLRARYDQILRDFGTKMNQNLLDAQRAFDEVVQNSPDKPAEPASQASGESSDE